MKFKTLLVTTLCCLGSLTAVPAQKATSTTSTNDAATIYLRQCVTAVNALHQTDNAKADAIKTCEDKLLGIERPAEITGSKVEIDKGALKVDVWSGKHKRKHTQIMRMRDKCNCGPNKTCCCTVDMCCRNDFCCVWGKKGPTCR